ncbi:hypothetical protein N665_1361s0004 [Sinapis alba]|nr:hypothetical protein N665_1361s0004 [Sinapis alba]
MPLLLSERVSLDGQKKAELVKQTHEKAWINMENKTKLYVKQANKEKKKMIFEEGDIVWIHLRKERFPNERKFKLMPRIDGPFKIIKKINNNTYQLDLQGKYNVSSSFNVTDLVPCYAEVADLKSNHSQVEEDEMILASKGTKEMEQLEPELKEDKDGAKEQLKPEETKNKDLEIPLGPMTRSKQARFHQLLHTI